VLDLTDGLGADAAVEVTGVPAAIDEGFQLLGNGGRYLVMGNIIPGKGKRPSTREGGAKVRHGEDPDALRAVVPAGGPGFLSDHGDDYPFGEQSTPSTRSPTFGTRCGIPRTVR